MDQRFTTRTPPIPAETAEQSVQAVYGLTVRARPLGSERDDNFHLTALNGAEYLLKVSHPAEDPALTSFQTECLYHIATQDHRLPVPRLIATVDGERSALLQLPGQNARTMRLLTYLPGQPLRYASVGPLQRRRIGTTLAALDRALASFPARAPHFDLLWDITQASKMRPLLAHIGDQSRRRLATYWLDNYERHVLPFQGRLRAQIIHNDLNPHNVLVAPDDPEYITGIIDFGDITFAPVVCDVAVAASYQIFPADHPLETIADFVAGYHAFNPLEAHELDLLFDLIATRLVLTVAITGWRAQNHPDNSEYILRNNPRSWSALEHLASIPRDDAKAYFRRICLGS